MVHEGKTVLEMRYYNFFGLSGTSMVR